MGEGAGAAMAEALVRAGAGALAGMDLSTVGAAVRSLTLAFRRAGIDTPGQDARLLVAAACALDQAALIAHPERALGPAERAQLVDHGERRCRREPVSRILGTRAFWGLPFRIGPATLDPRPDSETVVEAALAIVEEEGWRGRPLNILDLGTGSGCLLLSLLAELPEARGLGLDVSLAATQVARENACRLGLAERARFVVADWCAPLRGAFDLVISNPPYVRRPDIASLAPEVREHDPLGALDGGPDGLEAYRALARSLAGLQGGGWIVLEVGAGQHADVAAILRAAQLVETERELTTWTDIRGIIRCVAAKARRFGRAGEPEKKSWK